jgi:hypothetical protein
MEKVLRIMTLGLLQKHGTDIKQVQNDGVEDGSSNHFTIFIRQALDRSTTHALYSTLALKSAIVGHINLLLPPKMSHVLLWAKALELYRFWYRNSMSAAKLSTTAA